MRKITTPLVLIFFIITSFSITKLKSQNCFISLSQPVYGTNGNVTITGQTSFPSGWYSSVRVDFGDGFIDGPIYNQTSIALNHSYIVNGNYSIYATIQAYNPNDSTQNCSTTSTILVVVTNVTTCNLVTSVNYFEVSQNTISITSNSNMPVINENLIIDGQQIPYADSTFYTFTQIGQHQVCYYATSADTLNPCTDTACVIYDNSNNNTNCNLNTTLNVSTINSDVAQITGYVSTFYNYNYISIDGQIFSGTDTMTYTFNTAGQHQICYYASYQDSSTFCADSACVIFNSTGGGIVNNCQASFYIWQDSLNTNSSVWLGINNSTGNLPLTYLWDFGDGTTSTQAYPFHIYNNPGNYVICLTVSDSLGCSSSYCDSTAGMRLSQLAQIGSLTIYAPGNVVGIKESQSIEDLMLMPNPADDYTSLSFMSLQNDDLQIDIVNLLGEKVYSLISNCKTGKNEFILPTIDLSSGCFLLKIKKGKSRPIVLKLIRR